MSAILKQKLIDIANGFTKYGLWKGGGSGGSSNLSELDDVTLTNLQTNDVLTYNGSVWVNDDNLHEYSTEEKIIGKWINGKPIYEVVVNFGYNFIANANAWTLLPIFPQNVECSIKFVGIQNDGTSYNMWNLNVSNSGDVFNYRSNIVTITSYIIQYTKTTD